MSALRDYSSTPWGGEFLAGKSTRRLVVNARPTVKYSLYHSQLLIYSIKKTAGEDTGATFFANTQILKYSLRPLRLSLFAF
jgi:hypothetical protein